MATGFPGSSNPFTQSDINVLFEEVYGRVATAAEQSTYAALAATQGNAVVETDIEKLPEASSIADPIIRLYQGAFGRVPDTGTAGSNPLTTGFAVNEQALRSGIGLPALAEAFVVSAEFQNLYGTGGSTVATPALIQAFYQHILLRAGSAAEVSAWLATGLDAAHVLLGFTQSTEFIHNSQTSVDNFKLALENGQHPSGNLPPPLPQITLTDDTNGQGVNEGSSVTFTLVSANGAADAGKSFAYNLGGSDATPTHIGNFPLSGFITLDAQGVGKLTVPVLADHTTDGPQSLTLNVASLTDTVTVNDTSLTGSNFTLTTGTDRLVSGSPFNGENGGANVPANNVLILAPSQGENGHTPTLNGGDFIALSGINNELDATFYGTQTASNVNITGVQTWVVTQTNPNGGTITITGGVAGGGPIISGLTSVTLNDGETTGSLIIGDNSSPVYLGRGAQGPFNFAVTVNAAVGDAWYRSSSNNYNNGVDVDITAAAFITPGSTITVNANSVGGFATDNGSYIIPDPILGTHHDPDNYDPAWYSYYKDSFTIAAGASAGGPTGDGFPATGAIGFTNWVVNSTAAEGVGGLNIIALGGEGSWSAQKLTLTDDGSNTMLFASFLSDSLGGQDWQNLKDINLTGTSGFVTLTGAEAGPFGLLSDLKGPITIEGGTGNSFYDLTALGVSAAEHSTIQGGSNTAFDTTVSELPGWSEVAFNNDVWTETGVVMKISNISIGDDASSTQGGTINMANFPLTPLANPYALIAEANPASGTVPFGLPYTYASLPIPASLAADGSNLGAFLSAGVVPAGFEVLQLLNPDGSTAVELSNNLDILNAPTNFAVNMQDVSDPDLYNVSITGVESAQTLALFVSDGASPPFHRIQPLSVVSGGGDGNSEVFSIPFLTIENYQNVNIVLPSELRSDGNDVGLGTTRFVVSSSDNQLTETVNFYDNKADVGGSPPGSEDNLYLGMTQTYGFEQFGSADPFPQGPLSHPLFGTPGFSDLIGKATVQIDVNLGHDSNPLAIINDFGTGRFEIGATNATNINAQSTGQTGDGGLIMDLPATYWGSFGATVGGSGENLFFETVGNENGQHNLGITVNGSSVGANLLQGSSGPIQLDHAANQLVLLDAVSLVPANDAYFGAVGDDTLTGGHGADNYFPEGGNDTVNLHGLSAGATGASSTVWFGFYDVGYSGPWETGTTPGIVYEQAITDIDPRSASGESFVDGYGTDLLKINNFAFGHTGDVVNFGPSDWAHSAPGTTVEGLVQWNATTNVTAGHDAHLETLGTAANENPTFAVSPGTDIVLDNIGGGFIDAAHLAAALTTKGLGDIYFSPGGLAAGHTADLLIAYQNVTTHEIDIADVTIVNHTAATINDTDQATSLSVHNLISISNPGLVGLANLDPHNLHFA